MMLQLPIKVITFSKTEGRNNEQWSHGWNYNFLQQENPQNMPTCLEIWQSKLIPISVHFTACQSKSQIF